jgi:predicted metal-dependent HD superfamily phosphohydrolase
VAATARLRFSELWQRLGATGAVNQAFDELAAAHGTPGRVYHTLDHVLDCLARLDEAERASDDRDLVEAAIWFHDIVYDPHRADNEARSAQWASRTLSAAGVPAESVGRIGELIRMTTHSSPPSDRQGSLLCDVDLSILGRGEREFDKYQERIREEYAWVPDPLYRAGRSRILSTFLQRDRIFLTDYFRDRYEAPARTNLRRALARLEA